MTEHSSDPAAITADISRRLRDIESRAVTMKAMATSMLNAAEAKGDAEEIAKAQAEVDRIERLLQAFYDGPPEQSD